MQPLFYHSLGLNEKPSTFFDIVTGNNDVFDKGAARPEKGYDKASGLGALGSTNWRSGCRSPDATMPPG